MARLHAFVHLHQHGCEVVNAVAFDLGGKICPLIGDQFMEGEPDAGEWFAIVLEHAERKRDLHEKGCQAVEAHPRAR